MWLRIDAFLCGGMLVSFFTSEVLQSLPPALHRWARWEMVEAAGTRTWVARCAEPCSLFGGGQREHGHLSCAAAWAAAPSFVLVQSWPFFFLLAVAGLSSVGGCGFSLSVHQAPNGSWAPRIGSMLSVFLFCSFFKYIYICLRCFFPIASNTSTSEAADVLPKVAQVLGEARHGLASGICSCPKLVIFFGFCQRIWSDFYRI